MADQSVLQKRIRVTLEKENRPLNKSELARALELKGGEKADLREAINLMVKGGTLESAKRGRFALPEQKKDQGQAQDTLIGRLRLTQTGMAWFMPSVTDPHNQNSPLDLEEHQRVFVAAKNVLTALDGDIVEIKLERPTPRGGRGARNGPVEMEQKGRVIRVVERRSGQATGIVSPRGNQIYVHTDDERLPATIRIVEETPAKKGQVVAVEITHWDRPSDRPEGRIVKILGWPGESGVDIEEIIHQHGLARQFPQEVLHAARSVPDRVEPSELKRREDWRERLVITIDPADAKDHDDAVWVGKTKTGWQLAVHIADVSHYVKPGTAIDDEARERGNSTYLVDRVLPMLPVELSNGICSLKPGVDRLTKCALMDFDEKGRLEKSRFFDAVICVPEKLSYGQAQEIITGKVKGGAIGSLVRESWNLASVLRKRRFASGALDLDMPEVRIVLNDEGVPTGFKKEEYNESHQLVEEFMLSANESVARALKNNHRPNIYRVHEDPDPDKLQEFAETARAHGYHPGDLTNKKHIQALIDEARGTVEEHSIKLGLLKSLKRATYEPEPQGHYGLSKTDYCHFTSPIRRYADLITHRSLQALLENKPKKPDRLPSKGELIEISESISNTERTSADAENESRRLKMLEWLHLLSREEKPTFFEATITELRPMGLFMECTEIMQRGVIKREDLVPAGQWRLEESVGRFAGPKGAELRLGQSITVKVGNVDLDLRRVDFILVKAGDMPEKRAIQKSGRQKTGGGRSSGRQSGGGKSGGGKGRSNSSRNSNRSKSGDSKSGGQNSGGSRRSKSTSRRRS